MTPAERMRAFLDGLQDLCARTGVTFYGGTQSGQVMVATVDTPVRILSDVREAEGRARAVLYDERSAYAEHQRWSDGRERYRVSVATEAS